MSTVLVVLWIVCGIFCFITYHSIFNVVYFDFGRGCIGEIIWSAFGGFILAFLFTKFWYIAAIIVVIILLASKSKN